MSGAISGLDHLLIGVGDLEEAKARYEALGFKTTPRGRHIGWGTANYCIMFPEDYLELLGIIDANQFTNNLDRFLESEGQGLLGLAFAGEDLEVSAERLSAAGIQGDGPKDLKRILELPEGDVLPRFQLLHLPPEATPSLRAFICRHLTPEIVWQEPWLHHPNSAQYVAGVLVLVDEPEAAEEAYARLFGAAALRPAEGGFTVMTGKCALRIRRPSSLSEEERGLLARMRPGPRLMEVAVQDLATAAACLERAGVAFSRGDDDRLSVAAEAACGAALVFKGLRR